METLQASVLSLASALGIGLLVGLERERKKGTGADRDPAGLRTFAITSLLGYAAMVLGGIPLLCVVVLGLAALLAVAYFRSRQDDPGLTTETSLLLVLVLGAYSISKPGMAVAVGVVLALLLAYREGLHHFARSQLSEQEVRDALTLAAAALVILPLVPDRFMGPYGAINPRTIWIISVLMMAISAAGHIAIRLVGPRFGLPLAGLIAGFASSTATIASMGGRARREPQLLRSAAAGAVMSCVATIIQMGMVLAVIDLSTLKVMWLPLLVAGSVVMAYGAMGLFRGMGSLGEVSIGRAFDLRLALGVGATVAIVQLLSALIFAWLGNQGVVFATAIGGFADAHASSASAATLVKAGKMQAAEVALPILAALTTNTASKCLMAWLSGGTAFSLRVIPGLLAMATSLWLAWILS